MTTIVYKEEMITSNPRNVKTKTFTVQIMGSGSEPSPGGGSRERTSSTKTSHRLTRGGSPKPSKKFGVKSGKQIPSYMTYHPHVFTITAYLPHEGGKRLKVSFEGL